jgi:ComF family protein
MRDMVHGLKYRDRTEGLALFGRWLARAGEALFADDPVLVPVPLYRGRLWRRRFNQSAMLAKAVSLETGLAANLYCLKRTRATVSQIGLSAEQRRRNVAGAFAVPESRRGDLAGKEIILVDDVITTGATANACARILKRAGAARVDVLALARVVDPLAPTL